VIQTFATFDFPTIIKFILIDDIRLNLVKVDEVYKMFIFALYPRRRRFNRTSTYLAQTYNHPINLGCLLVPKHINR